MTATTQPTSPRKVVLIAVVSWFLDEPGGSGRVAYEEARYLAQQGHDVWVLAGCRNPKAPEVEMVSGIHVLRYVVVQRSAYDPRRFTVHRGPAQAPLRRHLSRVDVIHGHSPMHFLAAADVLGPGARLVYSVHSPFPLEVRVGAAPGLWTTLREQVARRMEARCLRRADVVQAFSRYTRSLLEDVHGATLARKVCVCDPPVDVGEFQLLTAGSSARAELGWSDGTPVLFTLRRLVPRMGVDRLLHAAQRLRASGLPFRLVIGGTGAMTGELQQLAATLGITDRVTFAGRVPADLLPKMYACADAFVLPSAELECFGLPTIEAFACGCPVLATPVGAIPEVVGAVEPGWIAKGSDPDSLADLLRRFLEGHLPKHSPAELRAAVERRYSYNVALRRIADMVLTTGGEACN